MTIYVDVLFAINFCMDFVAIFLCNMILRRRLKKARILIASIIGGIYGVIGVLISMDLLTECFVFILVAIIICYVAFYDKSIKRLIGTLLLYITINCILAGVMSALYSLLNRILVKYLSQASYESTFEGARFFIIASISVLVSMLFSKAIMKKREITEVSVNIKHKGKEYKITGFSDSGNMLTEPISGKAVILISEGSALGKNIDLSNEKNVRYIPYANVSDKGILKGIVPEKITINDYDVDAIIASVNTEKFGDYEAIVPSSLV